MQPIRRRAATVLESLIVLSTLFVVLIGVLDLGLAAFRYNVLSAVARRVAREAIVRGAAAEPERPAWGCETYSKTAAETDEIAQFAAPWLATMDPSAVTIEMEWPAGTNREQDIVRVRVGYVHRTVVPFLTSGNQLNLEAQSAMRIVH